VISSESLFFSFFLSTSPVLPFSQLQSSLPGIPHCLVPFCLGFFITPLIPQHLLSSFCHPAVAVVLVGILLLFLPFLVIVVSICVGALVSSCVVVSELKPVTKLVE
jgi:hypothetical protein